MHSNVVNVRAKSIADVVAITCRLRRLTEVLLFVANVVLPACYNTSTLYALNGLGELDTGQDRVRTGLQC